MPKFDISEEDDIWRKPKKNKRGKNDEENPINLSSIQRRIMYFLGIKEATQEEWGFSFLLRKKYIKVSLEKKGVKLSIGNESQLIEGKDERGIVSRIYVILKEKFEIGK